MSDELHPKEHGQSFEYYPGLSGRGPDPKSYFSFSKFQGQTLDIFCRWRRFELYGCCFVDTVLIDRVTDAPLLWL